MISEIPHPSNEQVEFYLNKWKTLPNYVMQESSLSKLFQITYPLNVDIDDILIKVCALNDFYSTNILSPYNIVQHIFELKIDYRLQNGDTRLVNEIAFNKINEKTWNFYSFATKYCSHHKPTDYFDHGVYTLHYFSLILFFESLNIFVFWVLSIFHLYTPFIDSAKMIAMTLYFIYYYFHSHHKMYLQSKAKSLLTCLALFLINTLSILVFFVLYILTVIWISAT